MADMKPMEDGRIKFMQEMLRKCTSEIAEIKKELGTTKSEAEAYKEAHNSLLGAVKTLTGEVESYRATHSSLLSEIRKLTDEVNALRAGTAAGIDKGRNAPSQPNAADNAGVVKSGAEPQQDACDALPPHARKPAGEVDNAPAGTDKSRGETSQTHSPKTERAAEQAIIDKVFMGTTLSKASEVQRPPRGLFANHERVSKIQVGIDFGSKFTKIAYRIMDGKDTSPIVPLDMKISGTGCGCITPSSIGIEKSLENGREIWRPGRIGGGDGDLKTSLLGTAGVIDAGMAEGGRKAKEEQAVFFFWWLFQRILEQLRGDPQVGKYYGEKLRDNIIFNVCIPIAKLEEHDGALNELYKKILRCALKYLKEDQEFFDVDALRGEGGGFAESDEKSAEQILITPEPIAQVLPYMKFAQGRQEGKHIIIDIGGETIDFSIFDVGIGFQKLEIYNTYVHIGGMSKLERELMRLRDADLRSIYELLYTYRGKFEAPTGLKEDERSLIRTYFEGVHTEGKGRECSGSAYKKHPDTSAWEDLHVLLAGGGAYSKSVFYNDLCEIFRKPLIWSSSDKPGEYKEYHVNAYALQLPNFVTDKCHNIKPNLHRLLVAYGLCVGKKEYPESFKPYMIEPKKIKEKPHIMDDPYLEPYL